MQIYKTRETSLATFFIIMGNREFKIEPIADGEAYWFVFETDDIDKLYRLEKVFLETKLELIKQIKKHKKQEE